MEPDKQNLIGAIDESISKLHESIDTHRSLVSSIVKDELDEKTLSAFLEICPFKPREVRLKEAIKDAIEVLEESRKAFKSKKLEMLRKKLTLVLMDNE